MKMLAYDGPEIVSMVQPFPSNGKKIISASEKYMLKGSKITVEVVLPTLKRYITCGN